MELNLSSVIVLRRGDSLHATEATFGSPCRRRLVVLLITLK